MSQSPSIAGIYEVCIGIPDFSTIGPTVEYWETFGFHVEQEGTLSAAIADSLYGIRSDLRSVRLGHQTSDHGLIRLMAWDPPRNNGLELESMKVLGNRWMTMLTTDVLTLLNHAEEADRAGFPIRYTFPHWEIIYQKDRQARPFAEPAIGVREMMLLQPLSRQVLFQRFGYTMPDYGSINGNATFKASQITHMGMVIQDDSRETLTFYDEVLGLLRVRDHVETSYESSQAGREMFDLRPGEKFVVTAFDDPRSSTTDLQAARSGRLYIIRFPESLPLVDRFEYAKPGCLGVSLYTYQVWGIEHYRDRIQASSAKAISDIHTNEFGERSFSFVAPDGYFWTLLSR
jgi:catechol 2,3-dioxygenase-like lactoylglutathione lyase family enzyme